jgi:copper resistance protein B
MTSLALRSVALIALVAPLAGLQAQHATHGAKPAAKTQQSAPPEAPKSAEHQAMDHSDGHGSLESDASISPGPEMETPPPPEAGSGLPRAADAIWGAHAMHKARHKEHGKHGNFPVLWVQGDRMELQSVSGQDGYLWDIQGYYGGPTSRFWFKSEGEGSLGSKPEDAEIQMLWSRAVDPYWDVQLGVRQDVAGPSTTHAVIGLHGLAPYMFEVDAALFVSHRGDITAKVEAELDQRITQRLILQPRAEIGLSAQNIPVSGVGAGIDKAEIGLRLRYEIIREFAPYIGVEQSWRLGNGADYARSAGEDPSATKLVFGIRYWF